MIVASLGIVGLAVAEVAYSPGSLPGGLHGGIKPSRLPRHRPAPVRIEIGFSFRSEGEGGEESRRSAIDEIQLDLGPNVVIDRAGLPICRLTQIKHVDAKRAREVCGFAEVGHGALTTKFAQAGNDAFPVSGTMLLFNGRHHGAPAIFAQVTQNGTFPAEHVIVFDVRGRTAGHGPSLIASLPAAYRDPVHLLAFDLILGRRYRVDGQLRSYVGASCPLPRGMGAGMVPFVTVTTTLSDGMSESGVLARRCKVNLDG